MDIPHVPVELRNAILRHLPTIEDLFAASKSCRCLYDALKQYNSVVPHVLKKQIDAKLLPYAVAFLELDKAADISKHYKDVAPILEQCFSLTTPQATERLTDITLREALHIMQRHNRVQRLARQYAAQALELLQKEKLIMSSPSFSFSEKYRTERSFYIFEVYCSLLGQSKSPFRLSLNDQLDLFFKRFAPWENEQIACVHDFFLNQIKPAFQDVASHDVKFGDLSIPWTVEDNLWLQEYVSNGLEYLEELINAPTYEARHRLLNDRLSLASCTPVLLDCLLESNEVYPQQYEGLDSIFMDGLRECSSQHCTVDPDSGPVEIWFQAHEGEYSCDYVAAQTHRASRKIGYVMMDFARIDDMTNFDGPKKSVEWHLFDDEDYVEQHAQQLRSFVIRSDIFLRGGRGWWSEGDTSRIQWGHSSTMS